jgi:hypothetical protein
MDSSHVSICQHQFHQHYPLIGIPVEKSLFTVYSRSIQGASDLFQMINRYRYIAVLSGHHDTTEIQELSLKVGGRIVHFC